MKEKNKKENLVRVAWRVDESQKKFISKYAKKISISQSSFIRGLIAGWMDKK